jgi:hypothetical protein
MTIIIHPNVHKALVKKGKLVEFTELLKKKYYEKSI